MRPFDFAIVGGGIVGLAVAHQLMRCKPGCRLIVLEKETALASHQSGRNSGVIHSGIYYKPGSLKARFAREGTLRLLSFCEEHDLRFERCGKIIVATERAELPRLQSLYERGRQHGLKVTMLGGEQVRELEPHVLGVGAIQVPEAGIVSYREVCRKLSDLISIQDGLICLGTAVRSAEWVQDRHVVQTSSGAVEARFLVNCAGLQCDRVAGSTGGATRARIVPFRGEYFTLVPKRSFLIRGLVYPVPNPDFPFLGVHFTRMIDGSVHAGPNAVLAFKREGYQRSDFNLRDVWEVLNYPGFWRLAGRHLRVGCQELHRSWSKAEFVESLRRMVPEIEEGDLVPCAAGVRAQALLPDGRLVDDFLLEKSPQAVHVLNAPSPAATASLAIAEHVAELVTSQQAA